MKIKQFSHLAFNCKNLEKSVAFYRDILGCTEKFTLRYADIMSAMEENIKERGMKPPKALVKYFEKRKDKKWIVYVEFPDGVFVELFDSFMAFIPHKAKNLHYHYQHFSLVVEDIQKAKEELVAKGVRIDTDITLGPDFTYQMWIHDPDGNKFELMQYTGKSLQVVGN
jgi:lactoylglutathione lyase